MAILNMILGIGTAVVLFGSLIAGVYVAWKYF